MMTVQMIMEIGNDEMIRCPVSGNDDKSHLQRSTRLSPAACIPLGCCNQSYYSHDKDNEMVMRRTMMTMMKTIMMMVTIMMMKMPEDTEAGRRNLDFPGWRRGSRTCS